MNLIFQLIEKIFFNSEIVDSGAIGDVVTINHIENVLYWHFAHR